MDIHELRGMHNDNRRMRAALGEIARQKLTSELTEDEKEHADFEGAYDIMIRRAREVTATL